MATSTFDFAIEDVQLVQKACRALETLSDNTTQDQETKAELRLLDSVLRKIRTLSPDTVSEETIRTVRLCGIACQEPLSIFLSAIRTLELQLDCVLTRSAHDVVLDAPSLWVLALRHHVAGLKGSVGNGLQLINALFQVEFLQRNMSAQTKIIKLDADIDVPPSALLPKPRCESNTFSRPGNIFHDIHVSGTGRAHIGNTYIGDATLAGTAVEDLAARLDKTATTEHVDVAVDLLGRSLANHDNHKEALLALTENSHRDMSEIRRDAERTQIMLAALSSDLAINMARLPVLHVENPSRTGEEHHIGHSQRGSSDLHSDLLATLSTGQLIRLNFEALLRALRDGLNAMLLLLVSLSPAFQAFLRTLTTITRSSETLLADNIYFTDALNHQFPLPYQQFRHWSVVAEWLRCEFSDHPGKAYIDRDDFAVFRDTELTKRNIRVPASEWSRAVRPGDRIIMSMYVKPHSYHTGDICPMCWHPRSTRATSQSWTRCAGCSQHFLADPTVTIPRPRRLAPEIGQSPALKETETFYRIHVSVIEDLAIARRERLQAVLTRLNSMHGPDGTRRGGNRSF